MLTFFPAKECFPLFTSPFPGDGYDASILYARRVCSLNNEEKSYFCRDSDLPSYRFKCLRAACFSYDVDEQNMCGDMCKRTVALLAYNSKTLNRPAFVSPFTKQIIPQK